MIYKWTKFTPQLQQKTRCAPEWKLKDYRKGRHEIYGIQITYLLPPHLKYRRSLAEIPWGTSLWGPSVTGLVSCKMAATHTSRIASRVPCLLDD